jgi:hypothetical protein
VNNPVISRWGSSEEKAVLAIHPHSSERGVLAFSSKESSEEKLP